MPLKIAVFVSGNGSNLQALIDDAAANPTLYTITVVIASNPDCYALTRAQKAGIATHVIRGKDFATTDQYDTYLNSILAPYAIDYIALAGFMRLLSPGFVTAWHNKILNIHPSLLPSFKGKDGVEQAFETNVRIIGCTVHMVRAEMDNGPILAQAALNRLPDETIEQLKERLHPLEHICYTRTLAALAKGDVHVEGDQVFWKSSSLPDSCISI